MADGSIIIDTQIDTDEAIKGIKNLSSELKSASKQAASVKTLSSAFSTLKNSITSVNNQLATVKAAFQKVGAVIDDVTEAYKTQAKAENQLAQAAKNNPYLSSSSVKSLKQYASALQNVSNVGDEELLPMMAQLAASGRTQEEIQSTMAAALDLSASGAMSLDAAVDALNKTYAGTTGQLGRTLPEIASLTDEELAQGKAVDIVAQKYKGMASAIADTKIQAQNAKGDFKEAVGALTAPSVDAWNKFWKGFYESATSAIMKVYDRLKLLNVWDNKFLDEMYEAAMSLNKEGKSLLEEYDTTSLEYAVDLLQKRLEITGKLSPDETELLVLAQETLRIKKEIAAQEEAAAQAEAAANAAAQAEAQEAVQVTEKQLSLEKQLVAFSKEYEDSIAATKRAVDTRRQMGEVISDEAEQEEMLNAKTQAYLRLVENYAGVGQKLSSNNGYLQDIVKSTQELATAQASVEYDEAFAALLDARYQEALERINEATQGITESADELLGTVEAGGDKLSTTIQNAIDVLSSLRNECVEGTDEFDAYSEKIVELEELLPEVTTAEARSEIEAFRETLQTEGETTLSVYERLMQQKEALAAEYNAKITDEAVAQAGYTEEQVYLIRQEYAEKINEIDEQLTEAQQERHLKLVQEIADYTQQTASIVQSACDAMVDAIETEAEEEKEALAEKYEAGLISQEEYEAGIEAIEEEAAMKEYKIEMANWTAQLLEAAASIALGCARSLEQGMPQGAILAALTAAAGAVQVAAITAAKPQKPSFEEGGIVPGHSYTGDNVEIRANSGEGVFTMAQQHKLFNMINSTGTATYGTSYPITINNTQSNKVTTRARASEEGVTIDVVDAWTQHRIARGGYDDSFRSYESLRTGRRYL